MGTEADRSGRMSSMSPAMATTAMPSMAAPAAGRREAASQAATISG